MQKHEERSRVWHPHVNDLHGGRVQIPGDGIRHPLAAPHLSPMALWAGRTIVTYHWEVQKPGVACNIGHYGKQGSDAITRRRAELISGTLERTHED